MKLGLGTVQFGMQYGVSNTEGIPLRAEVAKILDLAAKTGIQLLDTAPVYGNAEVIIGQMISPNSKFEIVTKTPTFSVLKLGKTEAKELKSTFLQSLQRLQVPAVYGLLVHNADDLLKPGAQALIDELYELRDRGLVRKIGVSIYSGSQIDKILEWFKPDLVQLPVNILDQRLIQSGHLSYLKKAGIEVHGRSIFLQGLLLMTQENIPQNLSHARPWIMSVQKQAKELGFDILEAALGFTMALPEVDRVIVGINSYQQLDKLLTILNRTHLVKPENFHLCACPDESIINPSLWQSGSPKGD